MHIFPQALPLQPEVGALVAGLTPVSAMTTRSLWRACTRRPRGWQPEQQLPGLATNSTFLCFLFVKTHWFAWINDPSSGKHYSLPFLPATFSSPSRTLDSPHALLPELQRYKDTVRCVALGKEVSGHKPWLYVCWTRTCSTDPWLWKVIRIELS